MKNKLIIVLYLLLLSACAPVAEPEVTEAISDPLTDELNVYTASEVAQPTFSEIDFLTREEVVSDFWLMVDTISTQLSHL